MFSISFNQHQINKNKFTQYVKMYVDSIYSLSYLLLNDTEAAEIVTANTFLELCEPFAQDNWNASIFSIHAYQTCIRLCTESVSDECIPSAKMSTMNDNILEFFWYGLKLPLTEITIILNKSIPLLKEQLRDIRERACGKRSTVPILSRKQLNPIKFIHLAHK